MIGFYDTPEWLSLRYEVLVERGRKCECCGIGAKEGAILHVDHIKPRSKYPALSLEKENLQVLCKECNLGKSNHDDSDFRQAALIDGVLFAIDSPEGRHRAFRYIFINEHSDRRVVFLPSGYTLFDAAEPDDEMKARIRMAFSCREFAQEFHRRRQEAQAVIE